MEPVPSYTDAPVNAEEQEIGDSIITGWNKIITNFENQTIAFVRIVNQHLEQRPKESVTRIVKYICNNPRMKRTISMHRIWQGLRLVKKRPDLISFHETGQSSSAHQPYMKTNGEIFWEFYFELYKYQISDQLRISLEADGMQNKWSVRELRKRILKFKKENLPPLGTELQTKTTLIKSFKYLLFSLSRKRVHRVKTFIMKLHKEQLDEKNSN